MTNTAAKTSRFEQITAIYNGFKSEYLATGAVSGLSTAKFRRVYFEMHPSNRYEDVWNGMLLRDIHKSNPIDVEAAKAGFRAIEHANR